MGLAMSSHTVRIRFAAAFVVAATVVIARGDLACAQGLDSPPGEFSLGIGYANIGIGGSDSLLNSEDALRFDSMLSFSPFAGLPQLRIGAAFGVDLVLDNSEFAFISNGGAVFIGHADIPLFLLEPEFRVSWQQFFGPEQQWYVEPGFGIGG